MKEEGLPVVRIVDPDARFDRVRSLLNQWHASVPQGPAKARAAELEFLAAAETYFMMGRGR